MNDAQTWTSIGALIAVFFTLVGFTVHTITAVVVSKLEGFEGRLQGFEGRLEAFEHRMESKMEAGFSRLERRIDGLGRDVTTLTRRFLDGA